MTRILVIEDSKLCQLLVEKALVGPNTELVPALTLVEALGHLDRPERFDLILLDLGLPDGDGLEFLSLMQMRETHRDTPIFLLTGKSDMASKVSAFSLGADDYLTKPIDAVELKARVDMRLRKARAPQQDLEIVRRGKLTINLPMMRVQIEEDNEAKVIDLTAKEFKILAFLAQNEGKVFNRNQLVTAVWGKDTHVVSRTVDSHICGLRRKIKSCSSYLEAVPGAGYRFAAKVA